MRWQRRLRNLVRRRAVEREMAEEMRQHVELEAEERVRQGAAPAEALRQAKLVFGAEDRWREEARAARGWRWADEIGQDLRYAVRGLRSSPGFGIVAVLTLALAIGANTAVFGVVDGVLLRPLAYPGADRIVRLMDFREDEVGVGYGTISYPNFRDTGEAATLWQSAAAYDEWDVLMVTDGRAERVAGALVGGEWFDVLGVEPALGRFFNEGESRPGAATALVLSWGLWQEQFGGDRSVLGRTVETNGYVSTIIGVAPRGMEDPGLSGSSFDPPRMWRSPPSYFETNSRGARSFTALIRLKPEVPLDRAQAEVDAIQAGLVAAYPDNNRRRVARLVPLLENRVGDVRPALLVLFGSVLLVLVIACANVANLLLFRASVRGREIGLRVALGASRVRVVRQLLVESLVLAACGALLGAALAWGGTRVLTASLAEWLPRAENISVDVRVLGFTALVTIGAALLFGLVPALQTSRTDLAGTLRADGRTTTSTRPQAWLRGALVAAEVALAVLVLVGAGLLVRSLTRLQAVDPGMRVEGALVMSLLTPPDLQDASLSAFYQTLFDRVLAIPGVAAVGTLDVLPMSGSFNGAAFTVEGRPVANPDERPRAEVRAASSGVFEALGLSVRRGRGIAPADRSDAMPVVVVSESLARTNWGDADPVGERIVYDETAFTVVGVVADVTQFTLDAPATPTIYFPNEQAPSWMRDDPALIVRAVVDPLSVLPAARAAIRAVDPRAPISHVRTLGDVVDRTLVLPRFRTGVLTLFAAIALLLAVIGTYGLVSFGVARRMREIGVRMALGADRGRILRMMVWQGMRPVLAGVAIGMIGAAALTRVLESFLFGVEPLDPVTFGLVPLALAVIAAAAAFLPAHRAAAGDAVAVLREG